MEGQTKGPTLTIGAELTPKGGFKTWGQFLNRISRLQEKLMPS
jgi:hypothetical protein